MLVAAWGVDLNGWIICYAWSLFVYGVGVGGEYPITGTRALEQSGTGFEAQKEDKLHRGRNLCLAFLMQGWGQLFNQGILIILLLIFNGGANPPVRHLHLLQQPADPDIPVLGNNCAMDIQAQLCLCTNLDSLAPLLTYLQSQRLIRQRYFESQKARRCHRLRYCFAQASSRAL